VPPTIVRPARRTLERGRWNPRKGYGCLYRALTGRRRDDEPVRRVPSVAVTPVPPSRALQHHPRRCGNPGQQDVAMPAAVRPPATISPRADACTTTRRQARTPPPSKPLLDGYRTRRDALPEARFARTTVYSTALLTDKRRIHLRSASVRTYTFFTMGFPRF
jgi:hypothetical protein